MMLKSIKNTKLVIEFKANPRLQWLSLLVLAILLVSLVKSVSDYTGTLQATADSQQAMVDRLNRAASANLPPELVKDAQVAVAALNEKAPTVALQSIAEAEALTRAEKYLAALLKRARANLVGTEVITMGGDAFWQIRIELNGQLDSKKLITLLEKFDGSDPYVRLASFQYRPKVSNDMTLVADYLYRQGKQ